MSYRATPADSYTFDREAGEWRADAAAVDGWTSSRVRGGDGVRPAALKVGHLNVLFDTWGRFGAYKPHIVCSPQRYAHILTLVAAHDADVYCFNEATAGFLKALCSSEHVRDHYVISDLKARAVNEAHGVVVISKYRGVFQEVKLPRLGRTPVHLTLQWGAYRLGVSAAHLIAQTGNHAQRREQMRYLAEHAAASGVTDTVLVGDINLHSEAENVNIPDGYNDVWTGLHGTDVAGSGGFTFDCTKNNMNFQLWPMGWVVGFHATKFRARLDRCLHKKHGGSDGDGAADEEAHLRFSSIAIWADEPVYPDQCKQESTSYLTTVVSTLGDLVGVNAVRTPEHYLFPSDHFGLMAVAELPKL